MVVKGQAGVASIPRDVDVLDRAVDRQTIERQMRLQGAAVLLGLDPGRERLDRLRNAPVDPW